MAKYAPVYMTLYDGPDTLLNPLTLSNNTYPAGSVEGTVIGEFQGFTPGSVISQLVEDNKVKIVGTQLQVGPNPSEAGDWLLTIVETYGNADNSPRDTPLTVTAEE